MEKVTPSETLRMDAELAYGRRPCVWLKTFAMVNHINLRRNVSTIAEVYDHSQGFGYCLFQQ